LNYPLYDDRVRRPRECRRCEAHKPDEGKCKHSAVELEGLIFCPCKVQDRPPPLKEQDNGMSKVRERRKASVE